MRQTYVQVQLKRYQDNLKAIKSLLSPGVKLMAVVKADAYGHGLVQVSRSAEFAGADYLGVAIAEEGIFLREAGVCLPILVLSGLQKESTFEAVQHGLTLACFTKEHIIDASDAAKKLGKVAKIHLKLDTGMNRVGIKTEDQLKELLFLLEEHLSVHLEGAFTHFSCADMDTGFTDVQLERFLSLTKILPEGLLLHAANSAALLSRKDCQFGMVRAGICSYGYPPVATDLSLQLVLTWKAEINHLKSICAGDSVSYGANFTANGPMNVATLAVGYGDGYHRILSNKAWVLVNQTRCRILGRICMDQIVVDVSNAGEVNIGDTAVLIGRDGEEEISAEQLAALAETISYEVLLSISKRVPRVYSN